MTIAPDEHRQKLILEVARRRFISDGYSATGMEAIARDAGVSTATLYHCYPGKAELFDRVIQDASEQFVQQMSTVRASSGEPRDRLLGFAVAYARFMSDPFVRSVFRLVLAERHRFEATAHRFFEKGRNDFGSQLIHLLNTLRDEGHLRFHKSSWLAGQLMGMIEHPIFFVPLFTSGEIKPARTPDQVAEDAVETLLARYASTVQG
jgi:AcrR family transcriptional regulator